MKGLPYSLRNALANGFFKTASPVKEMKLQLRGSATVTNPTGAPGFASIDFSSLLPEKNMVLIGIIVESLQFDGSKAANGTAQTSLTATWEGDYAFGSAANADADLTDANDYARVGVSGGMPIPAAVSRVASIAARKVQYKNENLDNSAGNLGLFLNFMIDDASISADAYVSVEGELTLIYIPL